MMARILIALALGACGDNLGPEIEIVAPDAAIDAPIDAPPDACTREPSGDCCALLPDESAVRACVIATANPGDCGVIVCWHADCSRTTLNYCAPQGADGGM